MDAEKTIAGLLFEYDCVIVPGFGGFIGSYLHARVNPVSHSFSPPFKSLLFNVSLKQNDGLLATRIANREKISFTQANVLISVMVDQWNRKLRANQSVIIPYVGTLSQDKEGIIRFEQDRQSNFNEESFGLSSFISPAIRRSGFQKRTAKKITKYLEPSSHKRRIIPKPLRWAAILALPIGAAAILSITHFDKIRNLSLNYSSLITSVTSGISEKKSVPVTKIIVPARKIVSKPVAPIPEIKKEVRVKETLKPFAIIVGAFRIEQNANNLVADLRAKGYDAKILDITKAGLFRVSLQNFAVKEEALTKLNSVRSEDFSSAWLLEKNI